MAQPLRRQIQLIFVSFAAALLLVVAGVGVLAYREAASHLTQEAVSAAASVRALAERSLSATLDITAVMEAMPAVQAGDITAAASVTRNLSLEPSFEGLIVARPDGSIAASRGRETDVAVSGLPSGWLRAAARGPGVSISPPVALGRDDDYVLVLANALRAADGRSIGTAAYIQRVSSVVRRLTDIPLPTGSVITVTDQDSRILLRSIDWRRYIGRKIEAPGAERAPADVPQTALRRGIDGITRVHGNAVVPQGPLIVSVGIPTSVALSQAIPTIVRTGAIALATGVVFFGVALIAMRRWQRALEHLQLASSRVAAGDLAAPSAADMPSTEFARLQEGFAEMVGRLRTARAEIDAQVSEERRMREEVQSLQRQIVRKERLAAIGTLVAGVAHELNNPLQAIVGFSDLLQLHPNLPPDIRNQLALIQHESARANHIIRNLTTFGRQQDATPAPVRIRDIVASVVELRQQQLERQGIDLRVDEHNAPPVLAVRQELQQVLLNLVINAEQAMVTAGTSARRLHIRVRRHGPMVRLEVEDTGPGVSEGHESDLFQPFFTTKPVGEGTGLGLSVSYGIVQAHGGLMGYRRATTGGAVFHVDLPACDERAASSAA